MCGQGLGGRGRRRHSGHAHVQRHPHDFVVHERALGAKTVGPAHVAVVRSEDHHRVIPRPGVLESAEHGPQTLIGEALELHVVIEVAKPGSGVTGVDVAPQAVLLVPAPLPVRLGLGVEVVVEVGRELLHDLVVVLAIDRKRVVVLPGRGIENTAHRCHVLGVGVLVSGLVDREPHDVMRIDEGDGQEPGLDGYARVATGRWPGASERHWKR